MKVYDISWPLTEHTTAYKDKKVISYEAVKNFDFHGVSETVITLGSHSGTHIDAPSHFLKDGATVESLDLSLLIGPCFVLDLTMCESVITASDLVPYGDILFQYDRILCKTRNSLRDAYALFDPLFIYLDASAAQFCVDHGVRVIGTDYLGIERSQPDHDTHTILLKAGVTIIEGLRLSTIAPKDYFMACLPLACIAIDGAPARAVLWEN